MRSRARAASRAGIALVGLVTLAAGASRASAADAPAEPTSAALAAALADASAGPGGAASDVASATASASVSASATASDTAPATASPNPSATAPATASATATHAAAQAATRAGPPSARTIEPRAFGYVLGDVLTQRIRLDGASGDAAPDALPSAGRVGVWLERRPARVETGADGRRWLMLSYQVTNSPPSLTTIELPALTLNLPGGAPLRVDAWPVSIGPLTPDATVGSGDLQAIRPDRLPPRAPVERIARRFGESLAALALVLIAWAAWWHLRNRREAARLPFARAWRDLRPANAAGADDPAAWRRLHRALDETAGRVVQHGTLAPLFARAPWLESLREPLEQFYRQSAARFFGTGTPAVAFPLRQLARELYLAERRRQR